MAAKKVPACPRTVTGTHKWVPSSVVVNDPHSGNAVMNLRITMCLYCSLIDDRETDEGPTKD